MDYLEEKMSLEEWLRQNVSQSENGHILLTDIRKKLNGEFSGENIGRALRKVFRGVTIKSGVRIKEEWTKQTQQYMGIQWKNQTELKSEPLTGVNSNSVPPIKKRKTELISPQVAHPSTSMSDHSYADTCITLTNEDSSDMNAIIDEVIRPEKKTDVESLLQNLEINEKMSALLKCQLEFNKKSPYGRRWNTHVIRLCLTLYCRSPKSYEYLSKSGFLTLPSARQIRHYKNKVTQESGFVKDNLRWMKNQAMISKIPEGGYEGGLLIDEMSIQEDVQLKRVGEDFLLIGFVEMCKESEYIHSLLGNTDLKLATHVLQFLFIGNTGFRFPVAHFPTVQTSPSELYLLFWKAVKMLSLYGFIVTYISMDGAQVNRVFMKMLLSEDQKTSDTMETMLIRNIYDPKSPKISIIMDYSHLMKKIRNNILKSGHLDFHKKHLLIDNDFILWQHWFNAYQWDTSVNTLKVHPKLTQDHFNLDSQMKMRNKLAEDVLDNDMLHLMVVYQAFLGEKGEQLKGSIELLKHTSVIVKVFRDCRPIKSYDDGRLHELKKVLVWFQNWEKSINQSDRPEKEKCLLSKQTREDLLSCLLGFDGLCEERFKKSHGSLVPSRVNSDAIENIFSQQRGVYNGPNTNPDYLTYCRTMNTIILGERCISRKSNTGTFENSTMFKTSQRKPLMPSQIQNIDKFQTRQARRQRLAIHTRDR